MTLRRQKTLRRWMTLRRRMTHPLAGPHDRGSVTAEIAVGLPAVVMVLAACLGALGLGTAQVRAQDAAADAARLLGRGEPLVAAQQHVERVVPGARLAVDHPSDLVCTTVSVERPVLLVPVRVDGTACALEGGR